MTMKQRIEQFLEEHRIPYEVVAHERTATSLQAAHAAHVDTGRLAKAVLLAGDDCFMAAMIPADHDVRLGQLQLDYGEHLHLADETAIREMFIDCDPGAVPGLPTAWGIETVWDDDLLAQPDIYLESGDHRRLIHLETRYLKDSLPEMPRCHFSGPRKIH